uniref:Retrovirus-related Pol polyprotein from transposon TNT 1-94 n=1 Tax=Tanacetum cinerariifolium TaxID=118510 RepID=A0A6L2K7G4_TANCI|nr:retrovirus-related Pol polyprotein from transposon TNT 1-94 [Tanacetum cinerariifolium]
MDSQSAPVVSAAKLPILNPNEFDLWKIRIEQYFLMTDYSLWEVIINGDSPVPTVVIDGVVKPATLLLQKLVSQLEIHEINVDDLEEIDMRWQMAMLTMRARRFLQKTGRNLGDNKVTTMGFDMSKVECYNCHRKGHFARECRSPKDTRRTGAAEPQRRHVPEEHANFALMAISSSSSASDNEVQSCSIACSKAYEQLHSQYDKLNNEFQKSRIDVLSYQAALESVEARLLLYRQNESILQENINMLKNEVDAKDSYYSESDYESLSPNSLSNRSQPSGEYHAVPPTITRNFMPPKPDLVFHTAPIAVETTHSAFTIQLSPAKPAQDISHVTRPMEPIIEDWVSDSEDESEPNDPQSAPSFIQTSEYVKSSRHSAQPVEAPILEATPKITSSKTNGSSKRKNKKTCFVCRSEDGLIKDCNFLLPKSKPVSVTTARPVSAAVPKIMVTKPRHAHYLNTKSNSIIRRHKTHSHSSKISNSSLKVTAVKASVVSAVKGKKGKWGNPQYALKDNGVIDSGCSRHMAGNMSYLSNFQELNGGYVAFGGNPKDGKISDFKLPNENQVLLRVPRENNMYNVNLKDIVLFGDLTCLFAKATIDESNLWHRRLGHINFKTINKLFCELKGIKKEFRVPRTPQQNGIAERKNRTLIEAAKTMLADLLLPIPFWVEVVNTACYVQNRVLVTKPQNKTLYELLHGRTPSIDFMRPFSYPVTILNTFDPLGKFEGKVDEGFLVGYSVNSKAFRVFNSKTRIVQETLHVNFLENMPNVAGTGPTWLFDIDSLTRTMNYQPVTAGNQSNPSIGFQEEFDAEKAGEKDTQQYMLFHVWSTGSSNPQNKEGDAAFDGKEHDVEKPESAVNHSPSTSAQSGRQDDMTKKKDKGKSHVEYFTGNRDLYANSKDYSEDSSNNVSAASPIVPTAGQNYSNITNPISAAGPSNTNTSPTHGKYSLQDASQMLEREDITYSDHENVGGEADFNNLEKSITFSPIPTTRINKDHPVARRNMMVYLKNTARFKFDYFKGMSYDDIRPIFEAKFNATMEFLLKSKEQMKEEESRAIAIINETPAQKATKMRRLNKEAKDF